MANKLTYSRPPLFNNFFRIVTRSEILIMLRDAVLTERWHVFRTCKTSKIGLSKGGLLDFEFSLHSNPPSGCYYWIGDGVFARFFFLPSSSKVLLSIMKLDNGRGLCVVLVTWVIVRFFSMSLRCKKNQSYWSYRIRTNIFIWSGSGARVDRSLLGILYR